MDRPLLTLLLSLAWLLFGLVSAALVADQVALIHTLDAWLGALP